MNIQWNRFESGRKQPTVKALSYIGSFSESKIHVARGAIEE